MKRKFIVLSKESEYEYDITVEKTDGGVLTTLFRSSSTIWSDSVKGEEILSMLNDGNGVKFNNKIGKKLPYDELSELRLLLNFENSIDFDLNQDGYKILEDLN
jgi:hypothetical protein